ncbi:MAG: outer membrane beta-barrel protein [Nitrospirales bacterium]|nr:outer membrane beta-barrel protein [Nitrospira sp.]MDR4500779.1 outer membrane beta-barrel protein [Nitrospirales bacterium]
MALDEVDMYLGVYALVSIPKESGHDIRIDGTRGLNSSLGNGLGGGLKIGVFPDFTRRMLGIELEYSGNNGDIRFQSPGNMSRSKADLIVLHSMVNLVLRYPGEKVRPYVGIGGGSSSGILVNAKIQDRNDKSFEGAITMGYQFLAGLHVDVSEKIFFFGEYKFVHADYHWKQLSVDFRSQYVIGGIGIQF